jgi:hypothetical protein
MQVQDPVKLKEKILSILREKGPSLPVHIANGTGLSILFSSAFLSELFSEKKIQISDMKVGSSPVYFLPEQKNMLENFSRHLGSKEKEAFNLLKEKKILKDKEQEPAIRVALRAIKDFAIPSTRGEEIFWRYFIFHEPESKAEASIPEKEKSKIEEKVEKIPEKKSSEDYEEEEKSDLKELILKFLEEKNIKLIEETENKKRDFSGIGRIETGIGEMEILIIGKDKKKVSEKDLIKLSEIGIENKKVVLFISTGEIDKKAKDFFRECKNLIRFFKI